MNIVLRQARIIDPSSTHHLQQADIWIQNGIIHSINNNITENVDKEIKIEGLCVSPGWVDLFAHFNDPGYEYKETLETGAKAAVSGGYTDVLILPNTLPPIHNKSAIEYIVQKSKGVLPNLHPIGAITKNTEGKELAEMYDMHGNGAVAFSDGLNSIQSSSLLLKALQYVKSIEATIIQLPDDKLFTPNGLMNEGIVSTRLGLPGKPAITEELFISRDIELVKYTGSKIHFTGISTAKSVNLIRKAKEEGLPVSCSVTPYHLYFSDEDLTDYDTNLKVTPPLRTSHDRIALQEGAADGTIDCIATHHLPQNRDEKDIEFEYAGNGMIGLQTSFGVVRKCLPGLSEERLIELFSLNARKIIGLPQRSIQEAVEASVTLFLLNEEWSLPQNKILSKSKNSPFIGKALKGKPLGIINKDSLFLNE
jgi:dihydroorotase